MERERGPRYQWPRLPYCPDPVPTNGPGVGWESATLKVVGFPLQTRTSDLHQRFAGQGNLVSIRFSRDEEGRERAAFLTFVPIPKGHFWASNDRRPRREVMHVSSNSFSILVERLRQKPEYIQHPRGDGARIQGKIMLLPRMLQFGVLVGHDKMAALRTLSDLGDTSFLVNFDFRNRRLEIGFSCKIENSTGRPTFDYDLDRVRQFKAQIVLHNIERIYSLRHPRDELSLIIVAKSPVLFFKKRTDIENTHSDGFQWGEGRTWQRVTDLMYDTSRLDESKTSLVKPNRYIDIGRWLVYQVYLPSSDHKSWEVARETLQAYNVEIINTLSNNLSSTGFGTVEAKVPTFWNLFDQHVTHQGLLAVLGGEDYHLPFAARYQLEACISQGLLIENNITSEFLGRLSQLARTHRYLSNPAADLLTYVCDDGKIVYDPMSLFEDRRAMTYRPTFRLPDYCEWVRKVIVTPTTMHLSSPTPETTNRILRQYRKYADRFLRVQFTEEKTIGRLFQDNEGMTKDAIFDRIHRTLKNGIDLAGRHYEFLAFGNSQFRENGAYFFHSTSDLTCDHIRDWMGDFSHIRVVAKFAARMGQCLSTTRTVNNLPAGVDIRTIPDIEDKGWCFTDGVGKISFELARDIADSLNMYYKGTTPSAFQFRLGGSKGLLVAWPQSIQGQSPHPLKFNQLHLRPSQMKFNTGSKSVEIIRGAEFSIATLNRQTITILRSLGVPDEVFMEMMFQQDKEYQDAIHDGKVALDLLQRHSGPNSTNEILAAMVRSGFIRTKEPCVMALLHSWIVWCQIQLKDKARLVVEQGAFLFGCVDETNTLRGWYEQQPEDTPKLPQIFVQVPESIDSKDYVVKTGICVVGRNPSMHPGDLRVVEAVDIPQLHHLRNVVVFPANGDRDIPSMCSGGDLDGDDFFVFWDQRLCPPQKNFPPMNHDAVQPTKLNRDVEIADIKDFFVEYMKNDSLSRIATSHLAWADKRGATHENCLELSQLHSKAVDYVKSGQPARLPPRLKVRFWPHFMENRWDKEQSTTALGRIFDHMKKKIQLNVEYHDYFDSRILRRYDLQQDELLKAAAFKMQYDAVLKKIMQQRDIDTEFEIFTTFALRKSKLANDYKRHEDIGDDRTTLHDRFMQAATKEAGPKPKQKFRRFVAACYRVTWEHIQFAKCHDEPAPFITFPWVFHKELGSIATEMEEKEEVNDKWEVETKLVPKSELDTSPEIINNIWDEDITDILDQLSEAEDTENSAAKNFVVESSVAENSVVESHIKVEQKPEGSSATTLVDGDVEMTQTVEVRPINYAEKMKKFQM